MRALITGVCGQDGPYLASQLHQAGHEVYGLIRGQHNPKWAQVQKLVPSLRMIRGDLLDQSSLQIALRECQPDVVYNLGALSFVGTSWLQPEVVMEITGLGCLRMLDAIRFTCPSGPVRAGLQLRNVRSGRYSAPAGRAHPLRTTEPVRSGQGARAPPDRQLPG